MESNVKILNCFLVVSIFVTIFLSNSYLFFSNHYLEFEYSRPNFPDSDIFSSKERVEISTGVLGYFNGKSGLDDLKKTGFFSEKELSHLKDVKDLKIKVMTAQIIFLVMTVIFTISIYKIVGLNGLIRSMKNGFLVITVFITIIIILVATNFDFWFIGFHKIFFEKGTWSFAKTDTLIQLYPEKFWFDTAIYWIGFTLTEIILLTISAFITEKINKQKIK